MAAQPLDDAVRHELYEWLDAIPLSRPKRFISRDFADAYLLAEVIAHYQPRMVELHNYPAALSLANKRTNWETLQSKVLRKLRISLSRDDIDALVNAMPNAIERVLLQVRPALERLAAQQEQDGGPYAPRERNHVPGERRGPAGPAAPAQRRPAQQRVRELYREEGSAAVRQMGAQPRQPEARWGPAGPGEAGAAGEAGDAGDVGASGPRDFRAAREPRRDARGPGDGRLGDRGAPEDLDWYAGQRGPAPSAPAAPSASSAPPPALPAAQPAAPGPLSPAVEDSRPDARENPRPWGRPAARQSPAARAPSDEEYERLQAKLQAADAERILMCQKIENLEKLLHMKDSRISAMNAKIQNLTAKVQALEAQLAQ